MKHCAILRVASNFTSFLDSIFLHKPQAFNFTSSFMDSSWINRKLPILPHFHLCWLKKLTSIEVVHLCCLKKLISLGKVLCIYLLKLCAPHSFLVSIFFLCCRFSICSILFTMLMFMLMSSFLLKSLFYLHS
ncbi:hypothetical protein GLYMA_13G079400v4 [Glycine max]|uniref:Uncharacterized protein n=1 Tax=Glycine max TaxID=3847 RepID=K7LX55_SOYBN|nr:hypothetical protein GYH30_035487 [Glycine max]KRH18730.1 hypothetical protein GLYMA_13G079400v4 [Glycine max]